MSRRRRAREWVLRALYAAEVGAPEPEKQLEVLLTHDPWQRSQLHPDHRAAGTVTVDAVVAARDPLFFPDQQVAPHRPGAVLLWSAQDPDHAEPIASTLDIKIEALLCHSSQGVTTMGGADQSETQRREFAARMRARAEEVGAAVGLDMAERFKRLTP